MDKDDDDENSAAFLKKCESTRDIKCWSICGVGASHFGDKDEKEVEREKKMAGNLTLHFCSDLKHLNSQF